VANSVRWIYDVKAPRHSYANNGLTWGFNDVTDGEYVYIGKPMTARVMSKGRFFLNLLLAN